MLCTVSFLPGRATDEMDVLPAGARGKNML